MSGRHRFPEVRPSTPPVDADGFIDPAVPEVRWGITHVDRVPWWEAPLPSRWHRCWPQTTGRDHGFGIERCPCGAARIEGFNQWLARNSRRREVSR